MCKPAKEEPEIGRTYSPRGSYDNSKQSTHKYVNITHSNIPISPTNKIHSSALCCLYWPLRKAKSNQANKPLLGT